MSRRRVLIFAMLLMLGSLRGESKTSIILPAGYNEPPNSIGIPAGFGLTISAPQKQYFPGERIPVTLIYNNDSTATIYVEHGDREYSTPLVWKAAGPDRQPAANVRTEPDGPMSYVGPPPEVSELTPGTSLTEEVDLSRQVWVGTPGVHDVSVASPRVGLTRNFEYEPRQRKVITSNLIKISTRPAAPGEIEGYIEKWKPSLDLWCTSTTQERYRIPPATAEAASALSSLHATQAIPLYLQYLDCSGVEMEMRDGLYGVPSTTAALTALRLRIESPTHGVTPYERRMLGYLLQKTEGHPPSDWNLSAEPELLELNHTKVGQAQLVTSLTLLGGRPKPGLEEQIAGRLSDLPTHLVSNAMMKIRGSVGKEYASNFSDFLEHEDEHIRREALQALAQMDPDRYLDLALQQLTEEHPKYDFYLSPPDLPKPLTSDQQLRLAEAIAGSTRRGFHRVFSYLRSQGSSKAIVPALRRALAIRQGPEHTSERGEILCILSRIEPAATRGEALKHLQKHNDHATIEECLYAANKDDPEFEKYNPATHSHGGE